VSYDASMSNRILRIAGIPLILALSAMAADESAKKRVITPKGTPAGRPFSAGILAGDTLYISGQCGFDSKTGKVPDKFEDEVHSCLNNVGAVLEAAGMDFSDVVAVQVYLTDMDLFQRMNAVYMQVFKEPRPTRRL
jgi:2-iminobutanoate/2-iminopropanoate deaminase